MSTHLEIDAFYQGWNIYDRDNTFKRGGPCAKLFCKIKQSSPPLVKSSSFHPALHMQLRLPPSHLPLWEASSQSAGMPWYFLVLRPSVSFRTASPWVPYSTFATPGMGGTSILLALVYPQRSIPQFWCLVLCTELHIHRFYLMIFHALHKLKIRRDVKDLDRPLKSDTSI